MTTPKFSCSVFSNRCLAHPALTINRKNITDLAAGGASENLGPALELVALVAGLLATRPAGSAPVYNPNAAPFVPRFEVRWVPFLW